MTNKKKIVEAKSSGKIIDLGSQTKPAKMELADKDLHLAKKKKEKAISNIARLLEVQKDGSIGLRTARGSEVRTMDILRAALTYCYTESVKQYDMMTYQASDKEKEDILYGMIVHDITGTQITMYDTIKSVYPDFDQDKLEKLLTDGKEKIIEYIMEELDAFYKNLHKDLEKKNSDDK